MCGFDKRLRENVEYLEELKNLAEMEGVSHQVKFMTSCSTAERNLLLSECLCVLYTPQAMASHKPVIGCNSGVSIETIKNGVTGFIVTPARKSSRWPCQSSSRTPRWQREWVQKLGNMSSSHFRSRYLVIAYTGNDDARKFVLDSDLTLSSIKSFGKDFLEDKLKPFYKSDPVPETNDGDVKIVVGNNFDEIVLDESKDVLPELYAPWCGHCQALEPIYNKLAKHLKGINSLVIAKMDGTRNEHPRAKSDGFPTILFFPAGNKSFDPITFDSDRTVVEFYKFLKKHASIPFKLQKPASTQKSKDSDAADESQKSGDANLKDEFYEPVASMDNSGKIIWAKHNEIQTVNIRSVGADYEVTGGERLPLVVKELGTCDLYPQSKKGIMVFALHEEPDLTELVGDFKVHIQITKETFNGIPARLFPIHNRQHHHQN
ncbi:unnamed protein product [Camellia sinensis]